MGSPEDLYKQVRSGKVKLEQLNDSGKAALKSYMASRETEKKETLVNTGKTVVNTFKKIGEKFGGQLKTAYSEAKERGEDVQADKKAKIDAFPKWRRVAYDLVNSPIGKKLMNANDKTDSFVRGAVDTASLGSSRELDKLTNKLAQKFGDSPEDISRVQDRRDASRGTTAFKVGQFAGYAVPGAAADRAVVEIGGAALKRLPKVVQGLIRGSTAGALDTAAQEGGDVAFREGQFDPMNVALGAGIGGGLGAAVPIAAPWAKKAYDAFKSRGRSVAPEVEQRITEILALPAPRVRGNSNNAITPDVINVPETGPRGLPEPSQRLQRMTRDADEARSAINDINNELVRLDGAYQRAVQDQYQTLKNQLKERGGVQQGNIIRDQFGEVTNRYGRQSNNPQWYQEFYAQHGKVPSNKELYTLAKKQVDEGYSDSGINIPSWRQENQYEDTREALLQVRRTLGESADVQTQLGVPDISVGERVGRSSSINPQPLRNKLPRTEVVDGSPVRPRVDITDEATKMADETPLVSNTIESFDPQGLKDISGFSAQTRDLYRNMEKVLGKENARPYLETFNAAKKDNIEMQEYWVNRLKTEVVDKLGIQKGGRLSALVQKFGEKKLTLDELKAQAPKDWEKVVEADNWFRQSYDNLIDIVNESRMKVYPNNPDKIVPKRSDYYRHFRELNGLEGLKNLFDSPSAIDPSLAGVSDFTSPKSKFAGFMQKRGLGPYKNDAVGGFLNYLPSASYATKIDPQISNFRSLASALADTTGETRNVNNFIEFLNDFSNDLSGKTNPADRFIQKLVPGGRKTMAAVSWLSNRVKTNVILGNVGSTLAQMANIPNGIAFAKQYAVPGAGKALKGLFKESDEMKQSGFLKERFSGKLYRQFDNDWISVRNPLHLRKMAEWMMETSDRIGTTFVWNSAYAKGVAENVANPVSYADDAARKLVAGRGIGEVPLFQKARITQLVLPFQLEVANLWRVMGDFVGKKDFAAIATLFAANYVFNRGMEQIKGSGVVFDPIQAMIEAFDEDLTPTERGGRVAGELFSNLPGGNLASSVFPEYGGNVLGLEVPTRKKLFGDNDPTRFGSGVPLQKAFTNPEYTLLPGFGGNQIKKTREGIKSIINDGSYTNNGELKFSIKQSPAKIAQQLLFGPNATSEAQQYFKEGRRPLGKKDTETYKSLPEEERKAMYTDVINKREREKLEREINEIQKDDNLSYTEKSAKIEKIVLQLKPYGPGGEKYVPKGG